ncbi:MAG: DUF2529 family protein [Candidatus Bathyarchaeia archaeon]
MKSLLGRKYFEKIDGDLRRFSEEQSENLLKAAKIIADAVLSGGRFWVYDKERAVTSEVTGRAGGLIMVQPLPDASGSQLKEGDVVAISAVRGDDASDMSLAEVAKAKGAKTIAIFPFRNPPGAPRGLKGLVDLAMDDYAEPGDGCLEVPGYPSKICPTTGVTNAAIMWAICAELVDELRRRGKEAHIYKSVFRVGSSEWNAKMREEFQKLGY